MKFEPEDRLLLRRHLAEGRSLALPGRDGRGAGHQMEADHRNGQAVDDRVGIVRDIYHRQDRPPDQVEGVDQVAAPAIEATLRGQDREKVAVFLPATQQLRFQIPAATLSDESHRQQFAVRAQRIGTRPLEKRCESHPNVVDNGVRPQAKIVEVSYHRGILRSDRWCVEFQQSYTGAVSYTHLTLPT